MIAEGVKPAIDGAVDANGGKYSAQMEQLLASGIRIFACEATLNFYNLTEDDLAFGVETVPSGVAALGQAAGARKMGLHQALMSADSAVSAGLAGTLCGTTHAAASSAAASDTRQDPVLIYMYSPECGACRQFDQ